MIDPRCWGAARVGPRLAAVAGLLACGPVAPALNLTAPQVVSIRPEDGATAVPVETAVRICASLPLQGSTLNAATVVLTRSQGRPIQTVALALAPDADGRCLTAQPLAPLSPLSRYTLELRKGILSAGGIALGGHSKSVVATASFRTAGFAAEAALVLPPAGALAAPLDLAQIRLDFSGPLAPGLAANAGPFAVAGVAAGPAVLAVDGRSASAAVVGPAVAGTAVVLALDPGLRDLNGQPPKLPGPLTFSYGQCREATAPSLGAGAVYARDTDAVLLYLVDRPSLCGAQVTDSLCPDAGALPSPARCSAPYDPCAGGSLCTCTVALVGLCPDAAVTAVPDALGLDGQTGVGAAVSFCASPRLPALVINEVFGGPKRTAFVEVLNRGPAAYDLLGLSLADCDLSTACQLPKKIQTFGPLAGGPTSLASGSYALLVDPAFDASAVPAGTLLLVPEEQAPLLHLSTTQAQSLALFAPNLSAAVSSEDGALLPRPGLSLERIDPSAADPAPGNWNWATHPGGTPAACNSVTPGALCAEGTAP